MQHTFPSRKIDNKSEEGGNVRSNTDSIHDRKFRSKFNTSAETPLRQQTKEMSRHVTRNHKKEKRKRNEGGGTGKSVRVHEVEATQGHDEQQQQRERERKERGSSRHQEKNFLGV